MYHKLSRPLYIMKFVIVPTVLDVLKACIIVITVCTNRDFFLYRQHCVLFMSLERCLNSWRCSCQPPKTCWMRRTMVIPETLLSQAMPFFTGWCTTCMFCWEGTFEVYLCDLFLPISVQWKQMSFRRKGCVWLLVSRTFIWHKWQKELFHSNVFW